MTPIRRHSMFPAVALLVVALAACGNGAPTPERTDANATPATDAAAPVADQPAQNVPPATVDDPATAPVPGTADQPAPDSGLDHMDGYGDMRFGMTADEAKKAWGGELKGGDPSPECYYLTPKSAKASPELSFMFEGGKFVRYDVRGDKETAPGGGKLGMTADEIGKLYAGRIEETPHKYVEGGKVLGVKDDKGGSGKLVFETDKAGKITSWRVGTAPQVDYVEGCS